MSGESFNPSEFVAKRGRLSGRVQGVGFRYFVYRRALEKDINGWVKNLFDGDVEVHIEGPLPQVEEIQQIIQNGPPMSKVIDASWQDVRVEGFQNFEITY
jgi:acylphosphatase